MVFTVILSFFAISLQAQTDTKTLKLFAPPDGSASDSILVWRHDDSAVRKVSPSLIGGGTYTGSTSVILNGSSFERAALTGDVTASQNSNATTISDNAVTSAKILDGTIAAVDLGSMGAGTNQVLKWNGTAWAPAADEGLTAEVDGIIGNEVLDATANGGLVRSGSGTAASP